MLVIIPKQALLEGQIQLDNPFQISQNQNHVLQPTARDLWDQSHNQDYQIQILNHQMYLRCLQIIYQAQAFKEELMVHHPLALVIWVVKLAMVLFHNQDRQIRFKEAKPQIISRDPIT